MNEMELVGLPIGIDLLEDSEMVSVLLKYTAPFAPVFSAPHEQKLLMVTFSVCVMVLTLTMMTAMFYLILTELAYKKRAGEGRNKTSRLSNKAAEERGLLFY